ncbi:MAG: von Willebrand factor type A domain-containing protein [Myxococcota bacterium]
MLQVRAGFGMWGWWLWWCVFMVGAASPAVAAELASLEVRVVDSDEFEIPNATVAVSQDRHEVDSSVTGDSGTVLFTGLPAGVDLSVTVSSAAGDGLVDGVRLKAGRTFSLVVMVEASEVVVITANEKPALDVTSLQRIPSGRTYQTAVQQAAGVVVGAGQGRNPNIAGACCDVMYAPPQRPQPVTSPERFTSYGIGGHVLTESDPLSTFSIDVDTASFAVVRRYLTQAALPPPAAVRVEELVNAQRYDDPAPTGDARFRANLEAAPHPWLRGHHLLRVGLKAQEVEVERNPVHLTFLVDVSGSMSSLDKLALAQDALHYLVDHLDPEDRVALVTYAGSTGIVLEPTQVAERPRIHRAIDRLSTSGGTNMASGMDLAYRLALGTYAPGTENRVIVLSDGDANIGASTHEQILAQLADYAKRGITLTTVGFGTGNYHDTLMEQLADHGDGNSFYVDTMAEAKKVFGRDLSATLRTVARDVKIQVDFDPESVLSYRLIGYENRDIADRDFRNDAVDAGEIGSGHSVTALYDLVLRDDPGADLATLRVRSKPPGPDAPSVEHATPLPMRAVRDELADATPDFRIAVATAMFGERLRDAPDAAEISYTELAAMVRHARRTAEDDALADLMDRAAQLEDRRGPVTRARR